MWVASKLQRNKWEYKTHEVICVSPAGKAGPFIPEKLVYSNWVRLVARKGLLSETLWKTKLSAEPVVKIYISLMAGISRASIAPFVEESAG